MNCLYIAEGKHRGIRVLKFGITKFSTPWKRLTAHAGSRDTPFATPVRLDGVAALIGGCVRETETILKRHMRQCLPAVCPFSGYPTQLSVVGGSRPSGEWLAYPSGPRPATVPFFEHARAAMREYCAAPLCAVGQDGAHSAVIYFQAMEHHGSYTQVAV